MNSRKMKRYKIKSDKRFAELRSFALQYPEWKEELAKATIIGSPNLDGMPHGTNVGNPTENKAINYADYISNVELVESCVKEADNEIYTGLLKGVTTPNVSYKWLWSRRYLFCGRDKYYIARAKFYYLLDQKKGIR